MLNKLDHLAALVIGEDPDMIIFCETWTNENVQNAEITFPGYNIQVRKDRSDTHKGRGGGVIVYTREGDQCHEIAIEVPYQQLCGIVIDGIKIYATYRSPNAQPEENEQLNCFIEGVKKDSLIIGDFNFPSVD